MPAGLTVTQNISPAPRRKLFVLPNRMNREILDILYVDEHLVAVDKPAGLLVHRSPIDRRETRFLLQILRDQLGQWVYPLHRLDKATSGVLLFGLNPEAARIMTERFAAGDLDKSYLAVARGVVKPAGTIDYPLVEEPERFRNEAGREPRQAVTAYRRLAEIELPFAVSRYPTSRYSLVEVRPRTGRRHQIRRHFKHIFHPLIGDTRFGEGRHNRFFREQFGSHRLLLHATELSFRHPLSGFRVTARAPVPGDFSALLDQLGWGLGSEGVGSVLQITD